MRHCDAGGPTECPNSWHKSGELRTRHPNIGKLKLYVLLRAWCAQQHIPLTLSLHPHLIPGSHYQRGARQEAPYPRPPGLPLIAPNSYAASANSALGRRISHPPLTVIAFEPIVRMSDGMKRYIITFICPVSRIQFAIVTCSHASISATITFNALCDLLPQTPLIVLSDNGSEFKGVFEKRMRELNIIRWFTRYKTPKMNAHCERKCRTI